MRAIISNIAFDCQSDAHYRGSPSAATTTLLAIEFDAKAELLSTVTLITTALSLGTVSLVLSRLL